MADTGSGTGRSAPRRAALYVRVSSARQVEEGYSLEEQEARCRRFIEEQGWSLDERHVYVERGVSGGQASRPALDAMRRAADAGEFDTLVGGDVDRIGRSAVDTLKLLDRLDELGIDPRDPTGKSYAASDPGSRMTRGVIALAAQYERDMLGERVRRSVPGKRERGSYNGGPRPYGYDFGEDGLVVNQSEAAAVRRMFREYNAGKSLRAIARELNTDAIRGPRGGTWSQGRVAERLDMPLYAGRVGGGKPGRHEPIIDEATWQRAQDLRSAQGDRLGEDSLGRRKAGRRSNTHLLGHGLLACRCGASMYPRKDSRSGRDTYRCRGRDERITACDMPPLPRADVDGAVRAYLAKHVLSPGIARRELEVEAKRAAADAGKAATAAEGDARKAEARLQRGHELLLDGDLSPAEWRPMEAKLQVDLMAARDLAADARRMAEAIRRPSADLMAAVDAIRQAASDDASGETVAAQRAAVERIFTRFEVVIGSGKDEPHREPLPGEEAAAALVMASIESEFDSTPEFTVESRGRPERHVFLVPIPRPEVAAYFGADPLDSLRELRPDPTVLHNVRQGLPIR